MDTIFLDNHDRKFWNLRASVSDSLAPKTLRLSESISKILPHPVTKVPTSHFEPRISHLPSPFNLFMNVQLIFIRGEGPFGLSAAQFSNSRFLPAHSKIGFRQSKLSTFTLFPPSSTLFHAIYSGGSRPSAVLL